MAADKDHPTKHQQQQLQKMLAVDELCDRLESALRENVLLKIEDLLAECSAAYHEAALPALIVREAEVRSELGQKIPVAEFLTRFPRQTELIRSLAKNDLETAPAKLSPSQSAPLTPAEMTALEQKWSRSGDKQTALRSARELIRAGRLTKFQAEEILNGRARHLSFGPYVVIDKLGQGGMGMVLRGEHREMKRPVAIKVLPRASRQQADAGKRFVREVQAAARLIHQNIVTAYDAGEHEGMQYLVMEFVQGSDLHSWVHDHGPMRVADAIHCLIEAARGLEYAHQQSVIHRDVKPANLLLATGSATGSGSSKANAARAETAKGPEVVRCRVKVLDMGLARIDEAALSQAASRNPKAGTPLTQAGDFLGTVDYMSPEQAADTHTADARADIYSLGCTLCYLLTGHSPYSGETVVQRLLAHRTRPILSLRAERADVPESLDQLFSDMLAKHVDDRVATMSEVIAALEDCQLEVSPDSQKAALVRRPSSKKNVEQQRPQNTPPSAPEDETDEATVTGEEDAATGPGSFVSTRSGLPILIKVLLSGAFLALATILGVVASNRFLQQPDNPRSESVTAAVTQPTKGGSTESSDEKIIQPVVPLAPWSETEALKWTLRNGGFARVHLDSGDVIEVRDLSQMPKGAFQVESLNVPGIQGVIDGNLARLSGLSALKELDLSGTELSDVGAASLAQLTAVTSLNVQGCLLGDSGWKSIGQMSRLVSLSVGDLPLLSEASTPTTMTNSGSLTDTGVAEILRLPNLARLTLSSRRVSEETILKLVTYCPNLASLELNSVKLTDRGIEALSGFQHLSSLGLMHAAIGKGNIEAFSRLRTSPERSSSLTQLNVQGNPFSPDDVARLQEIFPECVIYGGEYNPKRNFVRSIVQVNGHVEVAIDGNDGLVKIDRETFNSLPAMFTIQKADLHNVRPLSPDLLQLPEVTELNLADSAVSRHDLRQLPGRAPSVTILILSGTSVTDEEIPVLASMSSLQQIDLSRTDVSATGIAALKSALPQCEIISP